MTPEQFTQRSVAAAADLGLLFAGMPENRMQIALRQVQSNLETNLVDEFGPEAATSFAKEFVQAVVGHRREIGAGSHMSQRKH